MELVEQRDLEINEKNATIKSYLDKIVRHLTVHYILLLIDYLVLVSLSGAYCRYCISFLKLYFVGKFCYCITLGRIHAPPTAAEFHFLVLYIYFLLSLLKVNLTETAASKDARIRDLEAELGRLRATSDRFLQVGDLFLLIIFGIFIWSCQICNL